MKIKSKYQLPLSLLTALLFGAVTHADEKTPAEGSSSEQEADVQSQIEEALRQSGLDETLIGKISESLGESGTSSVTVQTTVIGPDGKVITSDSGTSGIMELEEIPDLNKLLSKAKKMAEEAASSAATDEEGATKSTVTTSVSGKVIVMGPDGKTQTHDLGSEDQNEVFQKAITEALSQIDLEALSSGDLKNATQVFEFGPAIVQSNEIEKRLSAVENKLEEQKALLEKILSKLE